MRTIKIKYNIENIISRMPSLFPILNIESNGTYGIVKATDFKNGSYGRIVPNISNSLELYVDENIKVPYIYTDNENYIYSYKTLMEYYYKYKDISNRITPSNSDAINFVDTIIGKINVPKKDSNGNDIYSKDQYLVPDHIYLANVNHLIDYYNDIKNKSEDICCSDSLYYKIGGDSMLDFLNSKKNAALFIATITYAGAINTKKGLSLSININLFKKEKDNGIKSIYSNEWIPGKEYESDENSKLIIDGQVKHIGGEPVLYNDNSYLCISKNKSSGKWDEILKKNVFDYDGFIKIPSIGYNRIDDSQINKTFKNTIYSDKYNFFSENSPINKEYYKIEGKSDSKLLSLRSFKSFLTDGELQTFPSDGEDWLSLYKIGVVDYNSSVDKLGNILFYGDDYHKITENGKIYVDNLYSYGSGIINIIRDINKNKLTFFYVLNAHLKAEIDGDKVDDLGNKYYYFKNFEFDFCNDKLKDNCIVSDYGKYNGVLYVEEYIYDDDSEINNIIDFDSFIRDNSLSLKRYPFKVQDAKVLKININGEYSTDIVRQAKFFTNVKNEKDYIYCPTYKEDFLSGITFYPKINKEINIIRGNNAAFERHIKLSEIKTMEDLENYQNGGFFNIQKIN